MKAVLILLLSITACEKTNDVARLRDEATIVAKYYQPRLDELNHRIEMIFQHGKVIPAGLPGIKETSAVLEKARAKLVELRKAAMPQGDGKSSIEAQAETAAKAGSALELERIVDDAQEELDAGSTEVNDELSTVEAWLAQAEANAAAAPAVKPPAADATPAP
jgi:hypothetical protein